jgi:ATP-dependent DNA helicase RecQ
VCWVPAPPQTRRRPAAGDAAFPSNSRVKHRKLGPGVVTRLERDRLTVLFERAGYKTLSLETVQRRGLLSKA